MSTAPSATPSINGQPSIIRTNALDKDPAKVDVLRVLPAWIVSSVFHAVLALVFVVLILTSASGSPTIDTVTQDGQIEDTQEAPKDLTQTEAGDGSGRDIQYNVPNIQAVSVPGPVSPTGEFGIQGGEDIPPSNIAPPLGMGRGQGGAPFDPSKVGTGSGVGLPGGYNSGLLNLPGGFGGRVGGGATRKQRALEGGGTGESEAAVGMGLEWLAMHQSNSGAWSLDKFHQHAHEKGSGPSGKEFRCDCGGQGMNNDIAGTAFGLLPFLGAGVTHQPPKDKPEIDYHKHVKGALDYLIGKEKSDGDFGGGMYAQGLATIAICEAYGISADPKLKEPAQRAIHFIEKAQHEGGGGWRYRPNEAGDTSVVGWQVMALKSGQMSGLSVKKETTDGATKFLNSVMTSDGSGYGYTGPQTTPTMTAVGLLCRQYLGWNYKNPMLIAGVNTLKAYPPGAVNSMYYYYYATQVMHHMGGDNWEAWNPKMRDALVARQDKGKDPKHAHQKGSWSPENDAHGGQGGRIMITSLSLLTLEVYYRHLPLYRRDLGATKDMLKDADAKP
jgi:hypothetical protein